MNSYGFERAAECFKLLFFSLVGVCVVGLELNCTRTDSVACNTFSAVKSFFKVVLER